VKRWVHALPALISLCLGCELQSLDGATSGETGGSETGRTLVLTTTDHSTGALVSIDTGTHEVVERALASNDAIPFVIGDLVYVVNRYGFDFLDIYDPNAGWARLNQIPLPVEGYVSTNPQSVVQGPSGELYVSLYGAPQLLVLDPSAEGLAAIQKSIDFSSFADADGIPESGVAVTGPDALAVTVQRLDRNAGWTPVDEDLLVFVDYESQEIIDLNPNIEGPQGLTLPGSLPRQARLDPVDSNTAYLLNTGLLKVDLLQREVEWTIPESRFEEAGIGGRLQPQSFAIDDDRRVYIAAYDEAFSSVSIYRGPLDGSEPLEAIATGHNAVERSLEWVDGHLWFGTTTVGDEGLLRLSTSGEVELGPLDTGLAPYAMAAF
jgi:hypothetical protein